MGENYGFPLLTPEECVKFFREISNTPISEEDFKKPDARRWHVFYQTIFEQMTGGQADLLYQHRLQTVSDSENPELQEESFSLLTFTMAMRRILKIAKVTDFTVEDILEPKPKRLVGIISAAVNFIRFQHFRKEVFNIKKDELERKRESFQYVLKENEDLKRALQAKRDIHASRMQRNDQLKQGNDAISLRIQEQHKLREVLQRSLSEVKSELSQRNASNDQLKVNILTAQAEGEKLSQRIVQSPERVKAEQDRAKNRIMAFKSTMEEKQQRLIELQKQKDRLSTQYQNNEKAVRQMRDISNDSDRLEELERQISRQQDHQQDLRSSLLATSAKLENLRQVQASRRDKLAKMDLHYNTKRANMQEQIEQLSHLNEAFHDPRGTSKSKKSELLAVQVGLKADIRSMEEDLEAEIERGNNTYFQILQEVDKMNMGLANGFGEVFAIFHSN